MASPRGGGGGGGDAPSSPNDVTSSRSSTVVDDAPEAETEVDERGAQHLPLLIVGPSGSGKTFNLAACAAFHVGIIAENDDDPCKSVLCLSSTNTSIVSLQVKVEKVLNLDVPEDERPLAQGRAQAHPPLHFSTIHHACRQWLARYGYLIDDRRRFSEICTADRVEQLLEKLERCNDPARAENPLGVRQILQFGRAILEDDLTIRVPSDEFLSAAISCMHRCRRVEMTAFRIMTFIKSFKLNGRAADASLYEEANGREKVERATELCEMYDELLTFNNLIDFEDLLVLGTRLLERHGEQIVQAERIGILVVDDLHNTSAFHRRVIRALNRGMRAKGRLLAACDATHLAPIVGGYHAADRTVFAFAGADEYADPYDLMRQCVGEQNAFNVIELSENRRSTQAIQRLAYSLLQKELRLYVRGGDHGRIPRLLGFRTVTDEIVYLQREIETIQLADIGDDGSLGSIAVLSRRRFHIRYLADSLNERGVALRILGQDDITLSSPEAIDLLSFLCASEEPTLAHQLERSFSVWRSCVHGAPSEDVPNAYFVDELLHMEEDEYAEYRETVLEDEHREYLGLLRSIREEEQRNEKGIVGLLDHILTQLKYKESFLRMNVRHHDPIQQDAFGARWENVQALLRRAQDFDRHCDDYPAVHNPSEKKTTVFLRLCDAYAPEQLAFHRMRTDSKVVLSTMHNALGSEFDTVFISGCERDSFPLGDPPPTSFLAERKLLFLSTLCARKRVYFTYCMLPEGAEGRGGPSVLFNDKVFDYLSRRR